MSSPVFTGDTAKPSDKKNELYYRFDGWDKELAPATENTTYTAQYTPLKLMTVMWKVDAGIIKTDCGEGMLPIPPTGFTTTVEKADRILTFTGWDRDFTPVTGKNTLYEAVYSSVTRYYDVSIVLDGKEVGTVSVPYNTPASTLIPEDLTIPAGYRSVMWANGEKSVTGEGFVLTGSYTVLNGDSLSTAYSIGLLGFAQSGGDNGGNVFGEATALLYLLKEINAHKSTTYATEFFAARCAEHLRNFVNAAYGTPYFDLEPHWCYAPLTEAIAVARHTPAVWDQLEADVKEQLDFVMTCFAYLSTLGTDDNNDYTTGPGMVGNYGKTWNPNYRLPNVLPIVFATEYFGSAKAVNDLLLAFDYEATVAKFEEYGFERALAQWTKPDPIDPSTGLALPGPSYWMENGGPAYTKLRDDATGTRLDITEGKPAGTGVGVRTEYTYHSYSLEELDEILCDLLEYNYNGGIVRSAKDNNGDGISNDPANDAYILDGTTSPMEGQIGMMLEFNSGGRSSLGYCTHDFSLTVSALLACEMLETLDITAEANARLYRMIWVGNTDFIYKAEHGYQSTSGYSAGSPGHESTANYYLLLKTEWLEGLGNKTLEDFPEITVDYSTLGSEDFEKLDLNASDGSGPSKNGFTYATKTGVTMRAVKNADGTNGYLEILQTADSSDPMINLMKDGGLAIAKNEHMTYTFSLRLAKKADVSVVSTNLRVRASSSSDTVTIISTDASGNVKMAGIHLTTLTEEFQSISVTVDFKNGKLLGFVGEEQVASTVFLPPSVSPAEDTAAWLDTLASYIFNWWMPASGGIEKALLVDDIKVVTNAEPVPDQMDDGADEELQPITVKKEDYSSTTVNVSGVNSKLNGITYGFLDKDNASANTVLSADGTNTYVLFSQLASGTDPFINYSDNLSSVLGGRTAITISVKLALPQGGTAIKTQMRLRASSSSDIITLFFTNGTAVYLGNTSTDESKIVGNLTEEFQTFTFTLDFETGVLLGSVNGGTPMTTTVSKPSSSKAEDLASWPVTATSYVFNWYFYSNTTSTDRTLMADDLEVIADVVETEAPQEPENVIVLEEHYTGSTVNVKGEDGKSPMVNGITYGANGKDGVVMQTVTEGDNTYLSLSQTIADPTTGVTDPQINATPSGGLYGVLNGKTALTVSLRLAKPADASTTVSSYLRLRASAASDSVVLFTTSATGLVYLGNDASVAESHLTTLTDTFQTITVTIDFLTGVVTGSVDGTKVASITVSKPSASTAETLYDWVKTVNYRLFNWHINDNKNEDSSARTVLIDDIVITAHDVEAETEGEGTETETPVA